MNKRLENLKLAKEIIENSAVNCSLGFLEDLQEKQVLLIIDNIIWEIKEEIDTIIEFESLYNFYD